MSCAVAAKKPKPGIRIAIVCTHKDCNWREFSNPRAACPEHGRRFARAQENRPYFGQSTRA